MTPATWGALLGAALAGGLLLVGSRVLALRRPRLEIRVLPYVRDLPQLTTRQAPTTSAAKGVFGPLLQSAGDGVERVLGGAASVTSEAGAGRARRDGGRVPGPAGGLGPGGLRPRRGVLPAQGAHAPRQDAVRGAALCRGVRRRRAGARPAPLVAGRSGSDGSWPSSRPSPSCWRSRSPPVRARWPRSTASYAAAAASCPPTWPVLADVRTGEPVRRRSTGWRPRPGCRGRAVRPGHRGRGRARHAARRRPPRAGGRRPRGRPARADRGRRPQGGAMMVPVVFLVLPVTVLFAFWPGVVGLS